MAEAIKMLFGLRTLLGPGNHGGSRSPWEGEILRGEGRPIVKYVVVTLCGHLCKTAEPIEMSFGAQGIVLYGSPDPPMGRGSFGESGASCKI